MSYGNYGEGWDVSDVADDSDVTDNSVLVSWAACGTSVAGVFLVGLVRGSGWFVEWGEGFVKFRGAGLVVWIVWCNFVM